MLKIGSVCTKISNYIAKELNFDDDKKSVINYGIFAFIHMGISIALVMVFGLIFNVTIEALIVSFTMSLLRKSSGGSHSGSPERCAVIGTASSIGIALICKYINISLNVAVLSGCIIFAWSYYIVNKLAPVDSLVKPIKSIEKRIRFRKISINILNIYLIIVISNILFYMNVGDFRLLNYSLCIYMGVLWQGFFLTKSGHFVLGKLG
ncbi:accessory protein regulator protein B [Clostridium beijerinckii]|uniref:accessory gene regulator ArgB-like protein n=1 Tax=Clostridium beijerinckii TaxID=1520 RepID=UPI00098CD7D1|nr:accessory gene regulator B family protein [Clostridium beijerinckii]OOM34600.1 accessory protein regulator protein B [Clostridium beijerinckii]